MSFLPTQPYKGTRDFYPDEMRLRNWMFETVRRAVQAHGYGEYGGPMLEPFELYAAKTGDEIVNQQLYSFMDRGERRVAIRPEMTPTLARLVAARFQELPRPVRLFCFPNFMRYERPQRGRLREFWQLNVDVLGGDPLLADAEVLEVAVGILEAFGGGKFASVRVNNRRLMDHFFQQVLGLTVEAAGQLGRLLDARPKMGEEAFAKGLDGLAVGAEARASLDRFYKSTLEEVCRDFACPGAEELRALFGVLRETGLEGKVVFDPGIMRGLDYYTGTVFEVFDESPENRRAMFGGGRYDNLLGLFGKNQLSGVGFGMGDVTLQNFLESHSLVPKFEGDLDVMVSIPSVDRLRDAGSVLRQLRSLGLNAASNLAYDGFGAVLKAAAKHGATYAILLGEEEWKRGEVVLKKLASGQQKSVSLKSLRPSGANTAAERRTQALLNLDQLLA